MRRLAILLLLVSGMATIAALDALVAAGPAFGLSVAAASLLRL